MIVNLAGYNLDIDLIRKLAEQDKATPETLAAAYARISRSKKNVTELRQEAIRDVARARKSNRNIVFEMGHSSVAEHAVFNFDLIGISRYLIEFIERSRLVSFTEKSQRYVTLEDDYIIPAEIRTKNLATEFSRVIARQNELYHHMYGKAKAYLENTGFSGTARELSGKAKEDARYVLALATQTQLGMTINARNLEKLLCRLDCIELQEATELKRQLEKLARDVAPSLIKYTGAGYYEKKSCAYFPDSAPENLQETVKLISATDKGDDIILTALAFQECGSDIITVRKKITGMSKSQKKQVFTGLFHEMKAYHSVPRAFELVNFLFQLHISSCCYGQLKRHRMCTIIKSDYHPGRGYMIPPLLQELNMEKQIEAVMNETSRLYFRLEAEKKGLGNYILTNGHKITVLFQVNLREMYHFSRLRSDKHAQWEIRAISHKMDELVKTSVPLAGCYLMGKDEFEKNYPG